MRMWLLLLAVVAGCQENPSRAPTSCDEIVPWPAAPVDCRVAGGVFQRQAIGGVEQPVCVFSDASDTETP